MSDLWVKTKQWAGRPVYREPTPAEILAAAVNLDGAQIWDTSDPWQKERYISDEGLWLLIQLPDGLPLPDKETTHACPPGGGGVTPCCGRTPFELPTSDRMTTDSALVTCLPDKETPNG